MASAPPIGLGAPGIYESPVKPLRALTGVRMDVCGFAGVAPRGPARVPAVNEEWRDDRPCLESDRPRRRTVAVAVESFEEYRRCFGGFEGPGLLPYAVAAFFEQGGRRAWVARVVHEYGSPAKNSAGVATGTVPGAQTPGGALRLRARSEGSWGNRLQAAITFWASPLNFEEPATGGLTLAERADCPVGTLLRLTLANGSRALRYVSNLVPVEHPTRAGARWQTRFDRAVASKPSAVEVVEATLVVQDGETVETHEHLGLAREHPRWMATVLCYESGLVYPDAAWAESSVEPSGADLAAPRAATPAPESEPEQFQGGEDRYGEITPDDFFDRSWSPGNDDPGSGVQCFAQIAELAMLAVPDLYSPWPVPRAVSVADPVSLAGSEFSTCVGARPSPARQETAADDLKKLRRDPASASDLAEIAGLQAALVNFAEQAGSFVVLLDVPPGLSQAGILRWRVPFDSSFAAAYHPWLRVASRDGDGAALVRLPPSAAAAGIIARQENIHGVPHGPANVIAAGVIDLEEKVSGARHDQLHPAGINVFLGERDGALLAGARTLSRNPAYRQLSVRRLMTMLRRTLVEKMQWTVFEPHTAALRADLRLLLIGFLRQLFRAGAFAGAVEEEAFFVRCDDVVNPPSASDTGRLVAEIGVAPAEPIEFLVLRLASDADGRLTVEE